MARSIFVHCFPYIIIYYVLMLVAYGIGASSIIIPHFIEGWDFIPSTSIPYDVVGWFWMAVSSIYCGGTALLNVFTSRNLHDLSGVDTSHEKLRRISMMNYFACAYCFLIKILGVDIPLEAIVSAAGACTVLIVSGKKTSEAIIQNEEYTEKKSVDEEQDCKLSDLENKVNLYVEEIEKMKALRVSLERQAAARAAAAKKA